MLDEGAMVLCWICIQLATLRTKLGITLLILFGGNRMRLLHLADQKEI